MRQEDKIPNSSNDLVAQQKNTTVSTSKNADFRLVTGTVTHIYKSPSLRVHPTPNSPKPFVMEEDLKQPSTQVYRHNFFNVLSR